MQAYNIFVKNKESEIKNFVKTLNETNSNHSLTQQKIRNLEIKCARLQDEAFKTERVIHGLRQEIKSY